MEKARATHLRPRTQKPVVESDNSTSDDESTEADDRATKRTVLDAKKKKSKLPYDKKVESRDDESFSDEDDSFLSKNQEENDDADKVSSKSIDKDSSSTKSREYEEKLTTITLISSDSSTDANFFSSKDRKEKKKMSVSNDVFDSLLSQDNKGKVTASAEKKQIKANTDSRTRSSSSENDDSPLTEDKVKKKIDFASKNSFGSLLSEDSKGKEKVTASAEKKQPRRSPRKQIKANADSRARSSSSENDEFPLTEDKGKKRSDKKRKISKQSPSKKVKSSSVNSSSDEDVLSPAKNRKSKEDATQESDSDASKDELKKKKNSAKRKASGSPSPSKIKNNRSDETRNPDIAGQESSRGLPVMEKGFVDVDKMFSDEESPEDLPATKMIFTKEQSGKSHTASPQKNNESESVQKSVKLSSPSKSPKVSDLSSSKDQKFEYLRDKHGESSSDLESTHSTAEKSNSVVSSDTENGKTGTATSDSRSKNAGRGRPRKLLSHSNSDKASSADGENIPSEEAKKATEEGAVPNSNSKAAGRGRGRPRKSKLQAVPEENGKTDVGTSNAVKETASNSRDQSAPVYAVKSKPTATKRKSEKSRKNVNKQTNTDKHSDPKNSARAESNPVSDKNSLPTSSRNPGGTSSGEKTKSIYTSSSEDTDSSEAESEKKSPTIVKKEKVKRKFSCHKCNAEFSRTQGLFDHICEGKRDKGFACESCDKIYKLRSTYVNHKIIHSRKKPYKCVLCGKKSSSQSNHLYHMKNDHPERKPFLCEFLPCQKSCMTRKELTDHHKTHKRHTCPYCDEEFEKKSTLLNHKYKAHEMFFS